MGGRPVYCTRRRGDHTHMLKPPVSTWGGTVSIGCLLAHNASLTACMMSKRCGPTMKLQWGMQTLSYMLLWGGPGIFKGGLCWRLWFLEGLGPPHWLPSGCALYGRQAVAAPRTVTPCVVLIVDRSTWSSAMATIAPSFPAFISLSTWFIATLKNTSVNKLPEWTLLVLS